jgi:tetratricopeptide (TPR) repeat protein
MRLRRWLSTACLVVLLSPVLAAQSRLVELNAAGWKALNDGLPDRAARLFAEALELRPNDPVLLLGAGAASQAQGRPREAIARLKRSLEVNPRQIEASQLLGQIAFAEGDVDLAVRTYENALKYAPGNAALTRELETLRAETDTHRTFESRKYDRFRVMFEGRAEESLAARATAVLDSAFYRIGSTLGEYPPSTIVTVLYTEQQFRDITRAPDWSSGQYDGRIRVPVAGASRDLVLFEQVLTHELVHAMIAGIAGRGVPAWLIEGLAQYFEGSDPSAARARLRAGGRTVPLSQLERGFGRFNAAAAQIAYDEALVAVSVMADRPGFGWIRLLHRLAEGQTFDEAIPNFGFSYADLEAPFR